MKATPIINSFVAGEISPRLSGRSDTQQYYQSAAEILNMNVEFYGGVKKAPGTYFVAEVKTSSLSTRIKRFVFSDTQAYILEFGNKYIRFYKDGGPILETHKDISGFVPATGVVTATSHGYTDGDKIYISEIVGTTELNDRCFLVANKTTHTFTLTDMDGVAINTSAFTAYSSAGIAEKVYTLTTGVDYLTADLFELQFAQKEDVLYITHPSYPQLELTRTAHTSWTATDIDYSTGSARPALMPLNSTATQLKSSADTGAGVTITADAAVFDFVGQGHIGSIWKLSDGYIKITAIASTTSATADVLYSGDLNNSATYTTSWYEGAWSIYRGFPKSVTLYENRLIFGYTSAQPQTTWESQIGAYKTFEVGTNSADAMSFKADTNEVEVINWLYPSDEILIGTVSGLHTLGTGSQTTSLTPTTTRIKKKSKDGTSAIIPQQIGNIVYYWQKYNRILREYLYSLDVDNYQTNDATAFAEHISEGGIVDMDYQQSPVGILWCVRADGKVAAFTRQIEQKVSAWSLHDTNGYYESVAVIPKTSYDEVWFVVKRTIEGVTRRYIEYMVAPDYTDQEDAFFVHSGLTLDNPKTITNATQANPVVITCTNDFTDGDIVKIRGLVERLAGAIPSKTVDAMEYSTNTLAQTAYVTDSTAEIVDQQNTTYNTENYVGDNGGEWWQAQSFQLSADFLVTKVSVFLIEAVGTFSGNLTARIETNATDIPSGTLANANATIAFAPGTSPGEIIGTFAVPFTLNAATTYWITLTCDNQAPGNYLKLRENGASSYANGYDAYNLNSVGWTKETGRDMWFKVYVQTHYLQSYSESTIKTQGDYSLKVIADITNSLNQTLTRTIAVPLDLTDVDSITFDIRALRTGSNLKIGLHDSGGTTTEHTPNILISEVFQEETIDLSGVTNADKNAIDSIIITITNADADNTIYIDDMFTVAKVAETVGMTELNNNRYIVAGASGASFHLHDLDGVNVDGTGFTAYDTGGQAIECVNSVSGLRHLASENVQVFTDGEEHPDRTVSVDGVVTLDAYYAQVAIGLGYTARLKTNDLEANPGGSTSQGKTKRVSEITANVYRSLDFTAGTTDKKDTISVRDVALATTTRTPEYTGKKKIPFPSGWANSKQVVIEQTKCLPLHILSLVLEMEVN